LIQEQVQRRERETMAAVGRLRHVLVKSSIQYEGIVDTFVSWIAGRACGVICARRTACHSLPKQQTPRSNRSVPPSPKPTSPI
jgi:hypothetical protein